MDTPVSHPLPSLDMHAELRLTVHHLCGMLSTVRRIHPHTPAATISEALQKHLKALTPAALGLPEAIEIERRIEARALADARADLATEAAPEAARRSA